MNPLLAGLVFAVDGHADTPQFLLDLGMAARVPRPPLESLIFSGNILRVDARRREGGWQARAGWSI